MNAGWARGCAKRCRVSRFSCLARCCRRSASSSAPAPPRVCAYVAPLLTSYLARLADATAALKLPPLHVMGSSGGVLDIPECLRMPAAVVESGPAAGVVAAALIGRQLGVADLISFDMGGTTAKASVIAGGEIAVTAEYEVGGAANAKRWLHGTGPSDPRAGDRSRRSQRRWRQHRLARRSGGALKVGPHSAGAVPGPAAYGRGGTRPTVTDAERGAGLSRSRLAAWRRSRGRPRGGERAIARDVAEPLGISVQEGGREDRRDRERQHVRGVAHRVDRARPRSPRFQPRWPSAGRGRCTPWRWPAELAIPEVIIPPAPGAFSALGLVASDLKRDYSRTLYADLGTIGPAQVDDVVTEMEADGAAMLARAGLPPEACAMQRSADLRYPTPGLRADRAVRRRRGDARKPRPVDGDVPRSATSRPTAMPIRANRCKW